MRIANQERLGQLQGRVAMRASYAQGGGGVHSHGRSYYRPSTIRIKTVIREDVRIDWDRHRHEPTPLDLRNVRAAQRLSANRSAANAFRSSLGNATTRDVAKTPNNLDT